MKKITIIASTLFLVGCFSNKTAVVAGLTEVDVQRGRSKFPDISLAALEEGKALYESHCGNCHGLKNVSNYSEEEWLKIVPNMSKKVNKKEGNVLDSAKEKLILEYVVTMAI